MCASMHTQRPSATVLSICSAFMLVGARHDGCTVGDVESKYRDEVRAA